jgi:hypothetical protein
MPSTDFGCLPTMIGSMPQTDASSACNQVVHYLRSIPAWPQLPKRSFLENMYVQYSQGFPGIVVKDQKILVDRTLDLDKPLEQLYQAYLENDVEKFSISREYAAGLYSFLSLANLKPLAVKGQVIGPVSWGLTVTDSDQKPIAYDDTLADAAAKMLKLRAAWQERQLRKISKNTVIFVDEPYMTSFGSAFFALSREKVISLLEEVFSGIQGLKGIHCCGNTDWSLLLETKLDILSFDAYNYAGSLSLYPEEVKKFILRGGAIAWGISPNDEETINKETAASLQDRLEEAIAPFTRNGLPFRQLLSQSLLTPCCGLAQLAGTEIADLALQLLNDLSARIRRKYS